MQNDSSKDFNRSYRERYIRVSSLEEVCEQTEQWHKEYNEDRPCHSLGDMTPREHLLTQKPEVSRNSCL